MDYTLMHKEKPVVDFSLDEVTGNIIRLGELYHKEHLPMGVSVRNGEADRADLNVWWEDRFIPASRSGIKNPLDVMHIDTPKLLLSRCFGLSLSDQYWIKPSGSSLKWSEINFFDHSFSEDVGDILFGKVKIEKGFDLSSPDNTSDGFLKKRWKIIDGKRVTVYQSRFCL